MRRFNLQSAELSGSSVVGLDFSFKDLIVTHTGARPKHPRWFKRSEKKLAMTQRKMSRKQTGSKGKEKQRTSVARIHEKIKNQRLDLLRKTSKKILDHYDVIVVEDIHLAGMAKLGRRRCFGKTIADLGFGMFRELLRSGASTRGKLFVVSDRWFPSNQLCSTKKCTYRNRGTKELSVREWTCPECGVTHDRDKNAARNEVNWYYEFVRYNTDAISEIYAGGDEISTLGLRSKRKSCQGNQKSYGTIDSVSPCL